MFVILNNILRMPRRGDNRERKRVAPLTMPHDLIGARFPIDQLYTGPLREAEEVESLAGLSSFIRDALAASEQQRDF